MNDMLLVLGDWSEDGHTLSSDFGCRSNKTIEEIQTAYKASCKLTGISFNHNDDYIGVDRDWQIKTMYHIATEYDSPFVNQNCYEVLEEYDCPLLDKLVLQRHELNDVYSFDSKDVFKHYIELWWWFVKLSLPDLEYEMAVDFDINDPGLGNDLQTINGYWNKGLNVQFGYGLYYV